MWAKQQLNLKKTKDKTQNYRKQSSYQNGQCTHTFIFCSNIFLLKLSKIKFINNKTCVKIITFYEIITL